MIDYEDKIADIQTKMLSVAMTMKRIHDELVLIRKELIIEEVKNEEVVNAEII